MKIVSSFFTLFFIINCVLSLQAATIIFHNETSHNLTIAYDGEEFDIYSKSSETVKSSILRRVIPIVPNLLKSTEVGFKIDNGVWKNYTIKHFVHNNIDTNTAIKGSRTKHLYFNEDGSVTEDNKEDRASLIELGVENFCHIVKKKINSLGSFICGKGKLPIGDILAGTTKNLKDKEILSIRILSPNNSTPEPLAAKGEEIAVKEREKTTKVAQEKFLNTKFSEDEIPLCIAFDGSGGGTRARISTTGFIKGAIDSELYDCATYFDALSGSTWMLMPWIIRNKDMDINGFIRQVIKDSNEENNGQSIPMNNITLPKVNFEDIKNNYYLQKTWNRPHGLIDMFGVSLEKSYLPNIVDYDVNNFKHLYLSDIREKCENGSTIIPIFEVRAEKQTENSIITHEPCFFSPWEFGSRSFGKHGACINIKTFGSNFIETERSAKEIKIESERIYIPKTINISEYAESAPNEEMVGPEPDLGSLMGIIGSAPTAPTSMIVIGTAQQNTDPSITPRHHISNNSLVNCEFNNFMHGKPCFYGFNDKERLYLHDAGLVANIPMTSLYRRPADLIHGIKDGDAPDIIFIFDSSDTSKGTIGEELLNNKREMASKGLPFPEIKEETGKKTAKQQLDQKIIDDINKNEGFYIFNENPDKKKYKDWEVPTIIYMTLIAEKEHQENRNAETFKLDFNKCNTFNFKYDEKDCKGLIGITAKIITANIEKIKTAMKKRRIINKARTLFALKEISKNKEKQDLIDNEIKINNKLIIQHNNMLTPLETNNAELKMINKVLFRLNRPEDQKVLSDNKTKIKENETLIKRTKIEINQEENSVRINQYAKNKTSNITEMLKLENETIEENLNIGLIN